MQQLTRTALVAGLLGLAAAICPVCPAQSADRASADSSGTRALQIKDGTRISAELESALDVRNVKPGDPVKAKVTRDVKQDGKKVIHKGDRLIGRVQSIEGGTKAGGSSSLAVSFDQLRQGETTSQLNAVITSVFSANHASESDAALVSDLGPPPMGATAPAQSAGGGGLLGGIGPMVSGAAGTVGGTVGSSVNSTASGGLATGPSGGIGALPALRDLQISSKAAGNQNAGMNSVLTAPGSQLHLDSGTRLEFKVVGESSAQAGKPAPAK